MANQKAQSADQAEKDAQARTKATNSGVEDASKEAAQNLEARAKDIPVDAPVRERFNQTDAILSRDEDHGVAVKKAQAASLGLEYKEDERAPIVPTPSLNQNNLKHPEEDAYTDPHMSKNYLGQPI